MLTKAIKVRLQKLINAVKNDDINELWLEFSRRMKKKQREITLRYNVGDEVYWNEKEQILTGTIMQINITTCKVRQNNQKGNLWKIDSTLLTKDKTFLIA
jgi:hypothetical protein